MTQNMENQMEKMDDRMETGIIWVFMGVRA